MVAKANMTSIRENVDFPIICIAQEESLKIFYLHKYLVGCDDL